MLNIIYFILLLISSFSTAIQYEPCELLIELIDTHSLSLEDALGLVCYANETTQLRTTNGSSQHFGIFAIRQGRFCDFSNPGLCGVTCDKFLDDDITDDLHCFNIILGRIKKRPHTFTRCGSSEWKSYSRKCPKEVETYRENDPGRKSKLFRLTDFQS